MLEVRFTSSASAFPSACASLPSSSGMRMRTVSMLGTANHMRVLVTGGSGFLGSWVCELLSKKGGEVRALVRRTSNTKHLETLSNVTLAEGTVEDARSVEAAAKDIDAIIHCAGLVKARNEDELARVK